MFRTLLASVVIALGLTASTAFAKGGPAVVRQGSCSASATWTLKVKADDGRIETELQIDENRVGKRWRVTLSRNGVAVFSGIRTTTAPSGSFTVRRLLAGPASGRIVATAVALDGGRRCRAALSF